MKFDGTNFVAFKPRLKARMLLIDQEFEIAFEKLETNSSEITYSDCMTSEGSINDKMVELSKTLKIYLLLACEPVVDPALQQESTPHGFELWRRLRARYDDSSRMTSMGRLSKLSP